MRRALLLLSTVLVPVASASAATATTCTASLSAKRVSVGQAARLNGRVTPHTARAVRLELKQGKRWAVAGRKRSSRGGRFSFKLPTATAGSLVLRIVVPRTMRAKRATCGKSTLTISASGGGTGTGGGGQIKVAPAFQAIHALASDQTADPGKADAIRATIDAVDGWYATQTTGGEIPRWTRGDDGKVVVQTVQLPHSVAEYAAGDSFAMVRSELAARGLPATDGSQKLAVFVAVTNRQGCGVTGQGATIIFEAACDIHPDTTSAWPFGATYLLGHELTHNLGAVSDCAPHADGTGHVSDDPRDVLYNGPGARDWDHLMLDPGHDDYYATGRRDCPGIEDSPFWTSPG